MQSPGRQSTVQQRFVSLDLCNAMVTVTSLRDVQEDY